MANFYASYPFRGGGGGGGGVTSLNSLTGALNIVAGSGITVSTSDPNITISSTIGSAYQEAPTGAINNVNVTFTLSTAPTSLAAFELFQDGLLLIPVTDYSVSGTTITMVSPPMFGQTLYAVYSVVSGGSGVVTAIADTASIDLTLSLGTLSADVNDSYFTDVAGTRASPLNITAVGGISFSGSVMYNLKFVQGSGGAVTVTANPQIAAGNVVGQRLDLIFRSNTNTLTLSDGTGLDLNGAIVGNANEAISLVWDGSFWTEISRRT